MTAKIIIEPTTTKDINGITSEQGLSWVKRIEMQHSQKIMLGSLKEKKEFDMIRKSKKQQSTKKTRYKKVQILCNISPAKTLPGKSGNCS